MGALWDNKIISKTKTKIQPPCSIYFYSERFWATLPQVTTMMRGVEIKEFLRWKVSFRINLCCFIHYFHDIVNHFHSLSVAINISLAELTNNTLVLGYSVDTTFMLLLTTTMLIERCLVTQFLFFYVLLLFISFSCSTSLI